MHFKVRDINVNTANQRKRARLRTDDFVKCKILVNVISAFFKKYLNAFTSLSCRLVGDVSSLCRRPLFSTKDTLTSLGRKTKGANNNVADG